MTTRPPILRPPNNQPTTPRSKPHRKTTEAPLTDQTNNTISYTRSYSNKMTYATLKGSGHTACTDKPEECFAMFKRWISHNPL
uniref:1-O-acylglucose:anthocyanin-O-acyltransferase n=1 Tax=Solanum tuberosum TaxID=4113 RepID=M1D8R6_SOLTU